MEEDKLLLEGLRRPGLSAAEALEEALERAVARGSLLMAQLEFPEGAERFYFLNSPRGRAAVKAIQQGRWMPSGDPRRPVALQLHRPTVYNLYEQNIGPLTPMIAERLREAEANYPARWIEEAIGIAVENNVRKWSYVEAILERWKVQGKDEQEDRGESEKARRKYLKGWFDG
jgi:DnaD/phage-associated family protein